MNVLYYFGVDGPWLAWCIVYMKAPSALSSFSDRAHAPSLSLSLKLPYFAHNHSSIRTAVSFADSTSFSTDVNMNPRISFGVIGGFLSPRPKYQVWNVEDALPSGLVLEITTQALNQLFLRLS